MKTMKLDTQTTIEIIPTSPFNFNATFYKPDHFTTGDHYWQKDCRWQTTRWQKVPLGLKFQNAGDTDNPAITTEIYSEKKLAKPFITKLKKELVYRYNLNLDLSNLYKLACSNDQLKKAVNNLRGMRPGHPSSLYEYLIIGIVLQNASVRRSIQMFQNLLSTYGSQLEFDSKKLLCIWDAGRFENVDEQDLRDLKVGYRAKSIKRIDEQFNQELLKELKMRKKNIADQKSELLSLYGIGPATVWFLLFDVFHRWEVFEHISPWEQKLYSRLFFNKELVSIDKLLKFINQFGEYKHLAVHYLWEDLWWRRENGEKIDWLDKEIRS